MTDYELVLKEKGVTQEWVDKITLDERDQIPFDDDYSVELRDSSIHGKGLFTTALIKPGEFICPARTHGYRTPAGRFINHSKFPNCEMVQDNQNNINVFAITTVFPNDELTIDYRQSSKVAESSCDIEQYNRIFKS